VRGKGFAKAPHVTLSSRDPKKKGHGKVSAVRGKEKTKSCALEKTDQAFAKEPGETPDVVPLMETQRKLLAQPP